MVIGAVDEPDRLMWMELDVLYTSLATSMRSPGIAKSSAACSANVDETVSTRAGDNSRPASRRHRWRHRDLAGGHRQDGRQRQPAGSSDAVSHKGSVWSARLHIPCSATLQQRCNCGQYCAPSEHTQTQPKVHTTRSSREPISPGRYGAVAANPDAGARQHGFPSSASNPAAADRDLDMCIRPRRRSDGSPARRHVRHWIANQGKRSGRAEIRLHGSLRRRLSVLLCGPDRRCPQRRGRRLDRAARPAHARHGGARPGLWSWPDREPAGRTGLPGDRPWTRSRHSWTGHGSAHRRAACGWIISSATCATCRGPTGSTWLSAGSPRSDTSTIRTTGGS
jgi:hypothetical protein